jgi:hypothetical protein
LNLKQKNDSESSAQHLNDSGERIKKMNNQDSHTSILKVKSYVNANKTLQNSPYNLNLTSSLANSKVDYDEDFINKSTERLKQKDSKKKF